MYYTICIPTYNRENTLLRTLESIERQNFRDFEVLIIDDGSTDNTNAVVHNFIDNLDEKNKYRYIFKNNGGKHSVLNIGFKEAKGEFFIILDSDDWLCDNALAELYPYCKEIENNDAFCGVMGKSEDYDTGKMIGDPFPQELHETSYFEYHFILIQKIKVLDSFEAVKTRILKNYSFPEKKGMKFVPEAYVFDQIGVRYKLLLTNTVFRQTQYLDDGMTRNANFKRDNVSGFLYHYISRIENVIPNANVKGLQKLKIMVLSWWRYWECVSLDKRKEGPRVNRVTITGRLVKVLSPVIDRVFSIKYGSR